MTTEVVFVGAGGQGRECAQIAEAMIQSGSALVIRGFYDDHPKPIHMDLLRAMGHRLLGSFEDLMHEDRDVEVCLGIGDGRVREKLDRRLVAAGFQSPVLVHPQATVGRPIHLSPGTVIFAGARLTTNISVGRHVHINQNATIGHDAILQDYATVNPLAAVSGSATIGSAAMIGAGAVVLQGRSVGPGALVGASACVVSNVPSDVTVKGVPAE